MIASIRFYAKNNFWTRRIDQKIEKDRTRKFNDFIEIYNNRFLELFRFAYHHSRFYNNLYKRKLGIRIADIKDIHDIIKLPVLTRSIIKNEVEGIRIGPKILSIQALTSGTTGSPLKVYRNMESINIESAYVRNFRSMHGFKMGEPLLSIRGVLNKNQLFSFNKLSNTLFISGPNLNKNNIVMICSLIKSFNPKAIEAFPSYLYQLYIELSKLKENIKIPICFTSSEMIYEFQREKIEDFFQTEIFDWYGNVERSIGIVQNKDKKYTPLPFYSINEYEKNRILTTSLNNRFFPLIRYQVEDSIQVVEKTLLENIVSPEIISINGRNGDTIDLADGSKIGCIDHAFKGISFLEYAQIYQNKQSPGISIKLVVENKFGKKEENQLKLNLENMIGKNDNISFIYCKKEELLMQKNGKYKLIIKEV